MPACIKSGFRLPSGAATALHILPQSLAAPHVFAVCVAIAPTPATPAALLQRGRVSALLTHDAGMSWPDRAGETLLGAVLDHGGGAMLGFETMADALACKRRLDAAR